VKSAQPKVRAGHLLVFHRAFQGQETAALIRLSYGAVSDSI